jgi:general secretion pathway protein D
MIQERADRSSTQLPLLGSIPAFGALFSNRADSVSKTELLILITPRVVRDQSEGRLVTEEYRRKMKVYMPHGAALAPTPANTALRILGR